MSKSNGKGKLQQKEISSHTECTNVGERMSTRKALVKLHVSCSQALAVGDVVGDKRQTCVPLIRPPKTSKYKSEKSALPKTSKYKSEKSALQKHPNTNPNIWIDSTKQEKANELEVELTLYHM